MHPKLNRSARRTQLTVVQTRLRTHHIPNQGVWILTRKFFRSGQFKATQLTPNSRSKDMSEKKKFSHRHKIIKKPAIKQVDGIGIKYAKKDKNKSKKASDKSV